MGGKETPQQVVPAGAVEAPTTVETPPSGSDQRSDLSSAPAEGLMDEKVSLAALAGLENGGDIMLDKKRFSGVFAQIKEINSKVEEGKKISISVVDNKFELKWAQKSAEVDLSAEGFEDKLLESIQNVLSEYKDAIPESNQYTELVESLKDAKDPVSAMCRVFAMWCSKYPGLADMLFFGGFSEKVKSGDHLAETFSESEKTSLKAPKKVLTPEDRNLLAASVERNLDPTHASFSYLAKVLWPSGEFTYKSPAGFAAQLRNAGENGESENGLASEYHHFYTEYAYDSLGEFKKNPTEGSIVFFTYGDGAKLPGGLGKVVDLAKTLTTEGDDQQKAPGFFMGHIIDGKLEYYNATEAKVVSLELNDAKLDISLAYSPTDYLIREQRPQEDKEKELKTIEMKKTMDDKAALVTKLEEDLKKLEDSYQEIEQMEVLSEDIKGAVSVSSNDLFAQAALEQKKADFDALKDKHQDYIRATDKDQFRGDKNEAMSKAREELEAAKVAAQKAKEAYESATTN